MRHRCLACRRPRPLVMPAAMPRLRRGVAGSNKQLGPVKTWANAHAVAPSEALRRSPARSGRIRSSALRVAIGTSTVLPHYAVLPVSARLEETGAAGREITGADGVTKDGCV
jgi:hypothetical protein